MKNLDPEIRTLLEVSTLTLATVGPDGDPHAAPVYFAADGALRHYFFSAPESRHSQDLARDNRVAVAIYPECNGWEEIRGLQMHGTARALQPGTAWNRAWEHYIDKFPFVSHMMEEVASNQFYVFVPLWIRMVDNRRGFGYKQEWTLT